MDSKTKRNLMYGGIAVVVVIVLVVVYMMMDKKSTQSGNATCPHQKACPICPPQQTCPTCPPQKACPPCVFTVLDGNVLPTVGSNVRLKYSNGYLTLTGALSTSAQDATVFTVGADPTIIKNNTSITPAVTLSPITITGITYNPVLVTDGTYTIAVIPGGTGFFDNKTSIGTVGGIISSSFIADAAGVSVALTNYPVYRVQVEVINA